MMKRSDFPIFNNKPSLIYFDNAATTHKPQMVLDAMLDFYTNHNANVHRGVYALTEQATTLYEQARSTVARFIGARDHELVFTRGTTESINCFATSWAEHHLKAGDEIVITELEHHANILAWQQVAHRTQAQLNYIPVLPHGMLDMSALATVITPRTKLVAVSYTSNALGTHNDIKTIIAAAHAVGAVILIDAAQTVAHQRIEVKKLGAHAVAFSGHKMVGPTGIGVLYIDESLHHQLVPYQRGGGMVYEADFYTATWRAMPHMLEAGTPAIAQAVGLAAAVDYLTQQVDFNELQRHEASLCAQVIEGLAALPNVTVLGPVEQLKTQGHLVSFTVAGIHPHDVAAYLDTYGICVRAGHQCAQPLAKKMGLEAAVRVSFYGYNTADEVAVFLDAMKKLPKI